MLNFDYKFCKPSFEYEEKPLSTAASALVDCLQEDRFITRKMFTLSPPPQSKWTDVIRHENRVMRLIAEYEDKAGKPLRCRGFITRGLYGRRRVEAHLVFQTAPDMVLLKRLGRKHGNVKVTGDYDTDEDWHSLSKERKNCPPHSGCLSYVASHIDHDDPLWVENAVKPKGRAGPAERTDPVVRQGRRARRHAIQARKLLGNIRVRAADRAWRAQNNLPPRHLFTDDPADGISQRAIYEAEKDGLF